MDAIQVEHVSKIYQIGATETRALDDVSLGIAEEIGRASCRERVSSPV